MVAILIAQSLQKEWTLQGNIVITDFLTIDMTIKGQQQRT